MIEGRGNFDNPSLFFIVLSPNKNDEDCGRLFSDRMGDYFIKIMKDAEISLKDVAVYSLYQSRKKKKEDKKILWQKMKDSKAKGFIGMGAEVSKTILDKYEFCQHQIFAPLSTHFLPYYDLSYIFQRGKNTHTKAIEDVRAFKILVENK